MKKILLLFLIFVCIGFTCAVKGNADVLRDYDGIEVPKGTFIPVMNTQEISTFYCDVNSPVTFISTHDLYLHETNVVPSKTEFFGYIEKINEPIVGTNASMTIRVVKLRLVDGFEIPVSAYIYTPSGNMIGGEVTEPASYYKKPSIRQGFKPMVGYVPGASRKMGEHVTVASGAELLIILATPLFITHTVTN